MNYFVIFVNEDGEASIEIFSKDDLEEKLNEYYWGKDVFARTIPQLGIDDLNQTSALYIIKGENILPQVSKFSLK